MLRTSHELVEMPSRAAADSTRCLSDSGIRNVSRAVAPSSAAGGVGSSPATKSEHGVAALEAHLDVAAGQRCAELRRGL